MATSRRNWWPTLLPEVALLWPAGDSGLLTRSVGFLVETLAAGLTSSPRGTLVALGNSLTSPGLSSLSQKGLRVLGSQGVSPCKNWPLQCVPTGAHTSACYLLGLPALIQLLPLKYDSLRRDAGHWPPRPCVDTHRAPQVPCLWLSVEQ